ncbi:hypothetical protein HJG60_012126 [Phyllostomus discolor]|uniref:Uncharacterized protein n=1 Tax=Phyllostomus discolor TaxID=89673 RepID=A0A833ZM95_9CHIR|nr:hypothetical protein HJG60_012126 [Phyllostomus discolor]
MTPLQTSQCVQPAGPAAQGRWSHHPQACCTPAHLLPFPRRAGEAPLAQPRNPPAAAQLHAGRRPLPGRAPELSGLDRCTEGQPAGAAESGGSRPAPPRPRPPPSGGSGAASLGRRKEELEQGLENSNCEIIFLKMNHPRNYSRALEYTALIYLYPLQRREAEDLGQKAVKTLKMNNHVISEEGEKSVDIFAHQDLALYFYILFVVV